MSAAIGADLLELTLRIRALMGELLEDREVGGDSSFERAFDIAQGRFQLIASTLTDIDWLMQHEDRFTELGLRGSELAPLQVPLADARERQDRVDQLQTLAAVVGPASFLPEIGSSFAAVGLLVDSVVAAARTGG